MTRFLYISMYVYHQKNHGQPLSARSNLRTAWDGALKNKLKELHKVTKRKRREAGEEE